MVPLLTDDGRWTRLVVRPDAVTRFWCIGGFRAGPAYAEASGDARFADATLTSHVFLSTGATHVRVDELDDLYKRLTAVATDDPSVVQRLAATFLEQGDEWVAWCERNVASREARRALLMAAGSVVETAVALLLAHPITPYR